MENNQNNIEKLKKPRRKTLTIVLLVILGISLIAAGIVTYWRYFKQEKEATSSLVTKKNTKEVVNNLDGLKVTQEAADRHPLAIMIENHPEARPQIGLEEASLVYEAITEGGITRFMAVFGPEIPEKVGPVRSARTYFIDWLSEYNAFYSHVGGNLDALDKIKTDQILDLDQFALGEKAYWREPAVGKATEHTMYTSPEKLYQAAQAKGWSAKKNIFQAFKFKNPSKTEIQTAAQKITIDFSSPSYKVEWQYDPRENKYLRTVAGSDRLSVSNLLIQVVERWEAPTAINESGWAMKTIGEGKAKIFQQGKEINATWKKTSRLNRTLFYDSQGEQIEFIPGHFWYEIVPPEMFEKIKIE